MKPVTIVCVYGALLLTLLLGACDNNANTSVVEDAAARDSDLIIANNYKYAITELLKQDSAIPPRVNWDPAKVASQMYKLDLSKCPTDFAAAYVAHIHAWKHKADIQQALNVLRSDDKTGEVLVETLLQKIFGSDQNALNDAIEQEQALKKAASIASAEIEATFEVVERIAVRYGATLPRK